MGRAQTMEQQPAGTPLFVIPDEIIPGRRERERRISTPGRTTPAPSPGAYRKNQSLAEQAPVVDGGELEMSFAVCGVGAAQNHEQSSPLACTGFPTAVTCLPKESRSCRKHQGALCEPSFPVGL